MSISSKASHDLRSRLMPASAMKKLKEDEVRMLGHFVDLLDKMLSLEPSKRPAPKVSCLSSLVSCSVWSRLGESKLMRCSCTQEMLSHPFLR
jgi:hypothetical protein